jgi:hypothetical protein
VNTFRTTLLIGLICLLPPISTAGYWGGQTKVAYHFNIVSQDAQSKKTTTMGTADYLSSVSGNRRVVSFKVDVKDGADSISYVVEKTLDLHGVPVSMKYSQVLDGVASKVDAKFVPGGVNISTDALVQDKMIPVPKGSVLGDPSEEWFKTVTPKLGEQVDTTEFDIRHTRWMKATTKYVGDVNLQLGTKSYATHRLHIVSDFGTEDFYVDTHGDPVLIDESPQRVERVE